MPYNPDDRVMLLSGVLLGTAAYWLALEWLEMHSRIDALELRSAVIYDMEGLYKRIDALEDSATVKVSEEG